MRVQITESQYSSLLNVLNKEVILENKNYLQKAVDCGYKSVESWKKNKYKCPSKVLINAKKCGWSDILSYEVSGFKCTPNKEGYLSPDNRLKLGQLRSSLGLESDTTKSETFMEKLFPSLKALNPDRPDLVKKNYCKPFCISDKVSCFIRVVKDNKEKIKNKLGGINDSQLEMLMKAAIGIIAWQSDFGNKDRLYDIEPKKFFGITIHPWDVYKSSKLGREVLKKYAKSKNINEPSFGPAEFQISQFEKTGVESEFGYGIDTFIGSALATMVTTWDAYKAARELGLSSGPSENLIAKNNGVWDSVRGTGNHLWDLAISIHTWPREKMIQKYCKTDNPLFAAPCNKTNHSPFKNDTKSWENWKNSTPSIQSYYKKTNDGFPKDLKVLQNEPILNYYPFLSGAHGEIKKGQNDSKTMMEVVSGKIKNFGCVSLGKSEKKQNINTLDPDLRKPKSGSSYLA